VSERIGVAVLGTDHWYNLLPLLDQLRDSDTYELLSIADPLEQRGRGLAERYGATWFDSAGAALDVEGVVLAAVFSSTDRTSALVDEAAAHGKHIVCNKPVGMTIEAADRSVRAVDAAGVHYFPYESYARLTPVMQSMKHAVTQGLIGRLRAVRCVHEAAVPRAWSDTNEPGWWTDSSRSPGGGWIDHAIYQIDIARWLTDAEPGKPSGVVGTVRHPEFDVEDFGLATFRFGSDIAVTSEAHWLAPDGAFRRTVEVTGSDGVLIFDSTADTVRIFGNFDRLPEGGDIATAAAGGKGGWHEAPPPNAEGALFLRHIAGVLQDEDEAAATIRDSRANLAACLDFYASATTLT